MKITLNFIYKNETQFLTKLFVSQALHPFTGIFVITPNPKTYNSENYHGNTCSIAP